MWGYSRFFLILRKESLERWGAAQVPQTCKNDQYPCYIYFGGFSGSKKDFLDHIGVLWIKEKEIWDQRN